MTLNIAKKEFEKHLKAYEFFRKLRENPGENFDLIDYIYSLIDRNFYPLLALILIGYIPSVFVVFFYKKVIFMREFCVRIFHKIFAKCIGVDYNEYLLNDLYNKLD